MKKLNNDSKTGNFSLKMLKVEKNIISKFVDVEKLNGSKRLIFCKNFPKSMSKVILKIILNFSIVDTSVNVLTRVNEAGPGVTTSWV